MKRYGSDVGGDLKSKMTAQQLKTFTRWWNSHLMERGEPVTDLCEQINSGVLAFRLLEALEGFPAAPVQRGKCKIMGRTIVAKPKMKLQRMENLSMFLDVITKDKGIKLVNIGPSDVEEGNITIILGLTFELIKFYELGGIQDLIEASEKSKKKSVRKSAADDKSAPKAEDAEKTGVAGLLDWVKQTTEGVEGTEVSNGPSAWTNSFRDGKMFAALMDKTCPGIIDYEMTMGMVCGRQSRNAATSLSCICRPMTLRCSLRRGNAASPSPDPHRRARPTLASTGAGTPSGDVLRGGREAYECAKAPRC